MDEYPNVKMTEIELSRAVQLRWTLRDILSNRTKISPLKPDHVEQLVEFGLIEIVDDVPLVTEAGKSIL
jgi:hypothetical protein